MPFHSTAGFQRFGNPCFLCIYRRPLPGPTRHQDTGTHGAQSYFLFLLLPVLLTASALSPRSPGGLPAAEAAGNPRLLQHAAAQFQRWGEGPQEAGEIETSSQKQKPYRLVLTSFCPSAGVDKRDGSDAPDGLQTHQLGAREDDDDAAHGPALQRGLPPAVLPVSPQTHTRCLNTEAVPLRVCFTRSLLRGQDVGLFCAEHGADPPGPPAESRHCCTSTPRVSAAQRDRRHHPLPDTRK